MAWIQIGSTNWEYSTTPEIDDPENADIYSSMIGLVDGIRTNSHGGTQVYVYCRQMNKTSGIGYGEIYYTPPIEVLIDSSGEVLVDSSGESLVV